VSSIVSNCVVSRCVTPMSCRLLKFNSSRRDLSISLFPPVFWNPHPIFCSILRFYNYNVQRIFSISNLKLKLFGTYVYQNPIPEFVELSPSQKRGHSCTLLGWKFKWRFFWEYLTVITISLGENSDGETVFCQFLCSSSHKNRYPPSLMVP
jgi:hypothetical protein